VLDVEHLHSFDARATRPRTATRKANAPPPPPRAHTHTHTHTHTQREVGFCAKTVRCDLVVQRASGVSE
jgi:hypothetical protein